MSNNQYQEDHSQDMDLLEDQKSKLILYNDDFHTFDFVIASLMDICNHTCTQAEQCALLVHYNGKCVVKADSYDTLLPMYKALLNRELTSEILR